MDSSNSNGISFPASSWGSFSSRYDRQPNYKNSSNIARPNSNEQNNISGSADSTQSNLGEPVFDDFWSPIPAGSFPSDADQSNFNDYGFSSGKSRINQMSNTNDAYQRNTNNFASRPNNQWNSNNLESQQSRWNSNNIGTRQNQGNSENFERQQNQNRFNTNKNFRPRNNFQSNSNKMRKSVNKGGSWFPGDGPGPETASFENRANKPDFANSNQQNQPFNQNNNTNTNYVPFKKFREHFTNRLNEQSNDNEPTPSLFMGRNESYPNELNNLMNPFFCGVCNSRLNSIKCANIHYESKVHDKQVSNWMKKHFTEKGLPVPNVQRFVTEDVIGPYRCELCKIDLTSAQHALQHFNGKRHRQAATKISPPTGIGYYNVDGNWVETGKVLDKVTGEESSHIMVNTPTGLEPVVLHVAGAKASGGLKRPIINDEEQPAKKLNVDEPYDAENEKIKTIKEDQHRTMITEKSKQQNATNSTTSNQFKTVSLDSQESSNTGQTPQEALNSQQCKICGVATTSYDQMLLHLKGIRHTKKLRSLGEPPISDLFEKSPTTILQSLNSNNLSDVSMYRTPTGSYFCKTCNVSMQDIEHIKKHISSKVHLVAMKKSLQNPDSS